MEPYGSIPAPVVCNALQECLMLPELELLGRAVSMGVQAAPILQDRAVLVHIYTLQLNLISPNSHSVDQACK